MTKKVRGRIKATPLWMRNKIEIYPIGSDFVIHYDPMYDDVSFARKEKVDERHKIMANISDTVSFDEYVRTFSGAEEVDIDLQDVERLSENDYLAESKNATVKGLENEAKELYKKNTEIMRGINARIFGNRRL